MRRLSLGIFIGIFVFSLALASSNVVLDQLYGKERISSSVQVFSIEDQGQRIIIDNTAFLVKNAEFLSDARGDNYYLLTVVPEFFLASMSSDESVPPPAVKEQRTEGTSEIRYYISVPAISYDLALHSDSPVMFSNITLAESKPVNTFPLATILGASAGLLAVAIWFGYRQTWGEATSTLLEHGLHDMTVRDVRIVGHIMERDEFTIPELMKLSKASKITVWRTVQRLVQKGLVVPTDKTRLSSNGLGGRGKPSRIYRYVRKLTPDNKTISGSKLIS